MLYTGEISLKIFLFLLIFRNRWYSTFTATMPQSVKATAVPLARIRLSSSAPCCTQYRMPAPAASTI